LDEPLPWKSPSSAYANTTTAEKSSGAIRRRRRRQETTDLREVALYQHSDGSYSCLDGPGDDDGRTPSRPVLRFATAYGFKNVQLILQGLSRTDSSSGSNGRYDYVEVMACPSGCGNGGGQVGANGRRETPREARGRVRRTASTVPILRPAAGDCGSRGGRSPARGDSIFGGECFGREARRLLHTRYHVVPELELSTGAAAGVAVSDTKW